MLAKSNMAEFIVSGPNGESEPYLVNVQPTQPGLLAPTAFQVGGKQFVGAHFPDNQPFVLPVGAVSGVASRPARTGDTIVMYGLGFGPVRPNLRAGTLVGASNSLTSSLQVLFGNTPATLSYAGLAPV